jgi:hypothetical protein
MTRTTAVHFLAAAIALMALRPAIGGEIRVVDATVPVRTRLRPPTAGRFGSTGYKLPLRVTVEVISQAGGSQANGVVDFALTNVGKTDLKLPISVHPRDLEPNDPNTAYAVTVLGIYLTRGGKKESVLPGRVNLYGDPEFPETMEQLSPGQSIRVITQRNPDNHQLRPESNHDRDQSPRRQANHQRLRVRYLANGESAVGRHVNRAEFDRHPAAKSGTVTVEESFG